jgi:hypothetical protein
MIVSVSLTIQVVLYIIVLLASLAQRISQRFYWNVTIEVHV